MVILYQIAIFIIIILSSFAGFKGLFIAVSLIVGFSLTNIFTLQLLVIQFTTIAVATVIGAVIAGIKLLIDMPKIVNNKVNSTISYFERNGMPENTYFKKYLLKCFLRTLGTFIAFSIFVLIYESFDVESISWLLAIIMMGWIFFMLNPGVSTIDRDGGFVAASSTFRFLIAIGCIYIGWRSALAVLMLFLDIH